MRRAAWLLVAASLVFLSRPAEAQRPYRSGKWFESGGGTGVIHIGCSNCADVTTAYGESTYLRLGISLSPRVLLGGEVFGLLSKSFNRAGTDAPLVVENVSVAPIVMWYPWKGGLFIKGGAGLAVGRFTISSDSGAAEELPARTGTSLTFGIGFDIPVFKWLSITTNVGAAYTALGDFDIRGVLLDDAVGSMYNANFSVTIR